MAIDFPASPFPGQVFTTSNSSWVWDGTKWTAAGASTVFMPPLATGDNRIINGDFRIDQRNAGASGTAAGYTVDRWFFTNALGTAGKGTWQQWGGSASVGFPLSLQFTSASAYTPLAGDGFHFNQRIEGDMVSDFAFGVAAAHPITLSFWVWTSGLTYPATLSGAVKNYANTRTYPFTYSVPAGGGAWTFISVTIPGDTGGAWVLQGNGGAMTVCFDLGSGANLRAPAGAWIDGNAIGANGAANVVAVSGAVFRLTGVKLEIGSVATPYNRQSLATVQSDCHRYYQSITSELVGGYNVAGQLVYAGYVIPTMRATPTVAFVSPSYVNASNLTLTTASAKVFGVQATVTATGSATAIYSATLTAEL